MKITIIADMYGTQDNGTSNAVKNLSKHMLARGHKVTVVSPYAGEDKSGIRYIQVESRHFMGLESYVRKNGVVLGQPEIDKLIRGIVDADVVHMMMPFKMSRAVIPLVKMLNIPYTTSTHVQPENILAHVGMKDWQFLNSWWYRHYWKKFYRNVEFVHSPTQFMVDELHSHKYNNRFRVITNGVRPEFRYIPMEKPKEFQDKFVILMTGRYSEEKRQDLLIKAVKKSKYRDKIQLVILGQGPREKKLKKLARGLKNPAIFGYLDYQDFIKMINTADLYVHTSETEIECLSCMEAMICARPCIFSDHKHCAIRYFARDEKTLFKAGNYKDLTKKIDYFIEHDDERRELGEYNLKYALEHFDMNAAMDRMEGFFKEAIEFYQDYYKKHPDGGVHSDFEPAAHDHLLNAGNAVTREKVDENYKYEHKNIFYRMYSDFLLGFAKLVLPPFAHIKYGYKIKGRKNIKKMKHKGAVLVSNHAHVMDGALICAHVGWRKTRFVMLAEHLAIPVAGKLMVALGGHPIADNVAGARHSMRVLNNALNHKKLVLIFPESSLHPYCTTLREFNDGAFRIAASNNVPIVPYVITFRQKSTKKSQKNDKNSPKLDKKEMHSTDNDVRSTVVGGETDKQENSKNSPKIKQKMYITICEPIYPNANLEQKERAKDLKELTLKVYEEKMKEFYSKYPIIKEVK